MKVSVVIEMTVELERIPKGVALSSQIRRHLESLTTIRDTKGSQDIKLLMQRIKYSE